MIRNVVYCQVSEQDSRYEEFDLVVLVHTQKQHVTCVFQVSYFEIYMDKIRDLLDGECLSASCGSPATAFGLSIFHVAVVSNLFVLLSDKDQLVRPRR